LGWLDETVGPHYNKTRYYWRVPRRSIGREGGLIVLNTHFGLISGAQTDDEVEKLRTEPVSLDLSKLLLSPRR